MLFPWRISNTRFDAQCQGLLWKMLGLARCWDLQVPAYHWSGQLPKAGPIEIWKFPSLFVNPRRLYNVFLTLMKQNSGKKNVVSVCPCLPLASPNQMFLIVIYTVCVFLRSRHSLTWCGGAFQFDPTALSMNMDRPPSGAVFVRPFQHFFLANWSMNLRKGCHIQCVINYYVFTGFPWIGQAGTTREYQFRATITMREPSWWTSVGSMINYDPLGENYLLCASV